MSSFLDYIVVHLKSIGIGQNINSNNVSIVPSLLIPIQFQMKLIHKYCKKKNYNYKNILITFCGYSVPYLNEFYNNDNKIELLIIKWIAIVQLAFKQRTSPLPTQCHYQEDYIIAFIQSKIDTNARSISKIC